MYRIIVQETNQTATHKETSTEAACRTKDYIYQPPLDKPPCLTITL